MNLWLAILAIPGVALAFHRTAEWWSRREPPRPRLTSAAIPIRVIVGGVVANGDSIQMLLRGAADAASANRTHASSVDASAAMKRAHDASAILRANGYFPTPIDPLHVERDQSVLVATLPVERKRP